MLNNYNITIHFAHKTFKWSNEAKGQAAVYVIITGFANFETKNKIIFDYETPQSEPIKITAKNINPYLVDGPPIVLNKRTAPICAVPSLGIGNKPIDGGNYLFTPEEKRAFIKKEPIRAISLDSNPSLAWAVQ